MVGHLCGIQFQCPDVPCSIQHLAYSSLPAASKVKFAAWHMTGGHVLADAQWTSKSFTLLVQTTTQH